METLPKPTLESRLNSPDIHVRLNALQDCLKSNENLDCFTRQALKDKSEKVQQSAYWILQGYNSDLTKNGNLPVATDTITSIVISPDNKYIVGGSWKIVRVWDAETGELLRKFEADSHWVLSVVIAPDNKTIITGGTDSQIKIWSLQTGESLFTLRGHSSWVTTLAVSPDGKKLVSGSCDKTLKIWDLNTRKQQHTLTDHSGWICSAVISSDGTIASGSTDNTIKLWNLNSGKLLQTLKEHSDWVQALTISSDGERLFSGSRNGEIKFWKNVPSDKNNKIINAFKVLIIAISLILVKFTGGMSLGLMSVLLNLNNDQENLKKHDFISSNTIFKKTTKIQDFKLTPDGKTLVIVDSNSTIRFQNIETEKYWVLNHSLINCTAISSDYKKLICGSCDWLKVWNLDTKESPYTFKGSSKPELSKVQILRPTKPLEVGEVYQFKAQGFDQYDKIFEISQPVIWQVTEGKINPQTGEYKTSQKTAKVTVTVKVGTFLKDCISIDVVEPPRLDKLVIKPGFVSKLYFREKQTFTVTGFDQYNKEFKLETVFWNATGGTIENGIYTAGNNDGTFQVTAKSGSISSNEVTVKVFEPPKLTILEISPSFVELEFGETQSFQVKGFDQYKQTIKIDRVCWTSTSGKINEDGTFTASHTEEKVKITATVGEIKAEVEVTVVEPAKLTSLEIIPSKLILKPGETKQLKVRGFDQRKREISTGNLIIWEAVGGKIDQQGCLTVYENAKGSFEVTASIPSYNLKASAQFIVPRILKYVFIPSEKIYVEPNKPVNFNVIAYDHTGERCPLDDVKWECSPGGKINSNGVFKGGYQEGYVTVTASVGEFSKTASVTLLPVLREININPSSIIQLEPGEHQKFTVAGIDQFNCGISPELVIWEATGGTINQQGYYAADYNSKGFYQVKAKAYKNDIKIKLFIFGTYLETFVKIIRELQRVYSLGIRLFSSTEENSEFDGECKTVEEFDISEVDLDPDVSILDLNLQSWMLKQKIKFILQILDWIAKGCIAVSAISDSVDVEIIPVLRTLELSSNKTEIQPGEQCTLTLKGYDQVRDLIKVNEVKWHSRGGTITAKKDNKLLNFRNYKESNDLISEFDFIAGNVECDFSVQATVGEHSHSISIKIKNANYQFTSPTFTKAYQNTSTYFNRDFNDFDELLFYYYIKINQTPARIQAYFDYLEDISWMFLPEHIGEKLNKIKKAQRKIFQDKGRIATIDNIAAELDMTPAQVREVLLKSLRWDLQQLLADLSPRERYIIEMRYGLSNGHAYSLIEIGHKLQLSWERVRQIEAKALQKLRQPKCRDRLWHYLKYFT
ncbi:sigma-70 family RNA polymerase sigma factor [Limnoraphis robusta]|uniref:sigma-70 family RNA polymerase sigma factor n=1 Tax=Limnoraphis robusta TaxID=1118279 RepID=UPI002B202809|nr:sigma-70 family RNA polymerase sigma factor [Limnoraphis robusta]MEA5498371.1 sigma-70 family RNA polymerase sigma factor [Limnoraphis robusta BA-68 BA1]